MTNQSAMVASRAVPYPNGLMPTRFDRIPAKIIISHALKKKNPPAAGSEKNGFTAPLSLENFGKPSQMPPETRPSGSLTIRCRHEATQHDRPALRVLLADRARLVTEAELPLTTVGSQGIPRRGSRHRSRTRRSGRVPSSARPECTVLGPYIPMGIRRCRLGRLTRISFWLPR